MAGGAGVRVMRREEGKGLGMAVEEPENFTSPNAATVRHVLKTPPAVERFWSHSPTVCGVITAQRYSATAPQWTHHSDTVTQ